jgi:hypothetical protein
MENRAPEGAIVPLGGGPHLTLQLAALAGGKEFRP